MKIGVDGAVFLGNMTGVGQYSINLLKHVAAIMPNDEFIVLSPNLMGQEGDLAARFSGLSNIQIKQISDWPRSGRIFWNLFGLSFTAMSEKLDVFWATNGLAPIFMPCPVCLVVYDFVYLVEPETMVWRARLWRSFSQPRWIKKAKKMFCISEAVAGEALRFYGRNSDAIIKPAVNAEFAKIGEFEIQRVRNKYKIEGRYALIVGTLEPRKNLKLFVETYLYFLSIKPCTLAKLVIIGGKGWKDRDILDTVSNAEKSGVVQRLGYVDQHDLPALYSGAEVFYMPSRYEGFGMPVLEARSCGVPVVCSDVPALHEAGEDWALYHAPTRAGILGALEQVVLGKKNLSQEMYVSEDSWDSGAAKLKDLLQTAIE